MTSVPAAVQYGLADALSMCDKPLEAFNILKNLPSRQVFRFCINYILIILPSVQYQY